MKDDGFWMILGQKNGDFGTPLKKW